MALPAQLMSSLENSSEGCSMPSPSFQPEQRLFTPQSDLRPKSETVNTKRNEGRQPSGWDVWPHTSLRQLGYVCLSLSALPWLGDTERPHLVQRKEHIRVRHQAQACISVCPPQSSVASAIHLPPTPHSTENHHSAGWGTAARCAHSRKNQQVAGWGGLWDSDQPKRLARSTV